MALHILVKSKEGEEPTLLYALHTYKKEQIQALNSTILDFKKRHGYAVTRIVVSGGVVTLKKPGELDVV